MSALSRAGRLLADLVRVNERYLRSPAFRRAAMSALATPSTPLELSEASRRELAASPRAARPYAGLSGAAVALSGLTTDATAPAVRLVLAELDAHRVFAGIHTALRVADGIAARLGLPLEVVLLSEAIGPGRRDGLLDAIVERLNRDRARTTVLTREALVTARAHPADVWIATHWTTAHPLQIAARAGVIDPTRVVYLVQDHEPGFTPLSTDRMTASATYRAGFRLLVNSEPVAAVLRAVEGVDVDASLVFAPDLDLDRLATIAAHRPSAGESARPVTALFYGRPSKPRNLFPLGVASLRVAAQSLPVESVRWISAGEPHRPVDLGGGHRLESRGTLGWDEYFAVLATSDVVLSLQASPHPSHPPLEAALSGALAITNEVAGTRARLHPRLRAVDADPAALGAAIVGAVRASAEQVPAPPSERALNALGLGLGATLDAVAAQLSAR